MAKLLWALVCDDYKIESGKVSIFGEFSNFAASQFPAVQSSFIVFTRWAIQPGEQFQCDVRLVESSSNDFGVTTGKPTRDSPVIDTISTASKANAFAETCTIAARFRNAYFPHPGQYSVEILVDGSLVHMIALPAIPEG